MSTRPTSVTVVSIIIIVLACFGLLSTLLYFAVKDDPMVQQALQGSAVPGTVQIALGLGSGLIDLICGILLLLRQGWARYVYVILGVANIIYTFATSPYTPFMLVLSTVFFLVVAYFLFTPKARAWFGKRETATPAAQ